MASFASSRRTVGAPLLHAFCELPVVRIGMTTGTVQSFPVIDHSSFGLEVRRFLVAISARHGQVAPGQLKMGLLVLNQRKGRRLISLDIVAAVAGIEIRGRGKLLGVPIAVAIGAAFEFHLEKRVAPLRNVALGTLEPRVTAFQRIRSDCMLFHREGRWLPPLNIVARLTLATVRPLLELPFVRIGFVAIHALGEGQRLLEIAIRVALGAVHADMLPLQRELCFRVIEELVHRLQRNLLPTARVVAGLATLRKARLMRISVAV